MTSNNETFVPENEVLKKPSQQSEESEPVENRFRLEIFGTEREQDGWDIVGNNPQTKELIELVNTLTGGDYSDGETGARYLTIRADRDQVKNEGRYKRKTASKESLERAREKAMTIIDKLKNPEVLENFRRIKEKINELCISIGIENPEDDVDEEKDEEF